jgi:DNA mismatch repair protein MutL
MTLIRRLPPALVNQIAAGEVIERPASVAKELIENAIDAGAQRIAVTVEEGGRGLVRVTDDGRGIAADELALALAAHATSKIEAQSDLDAIATMGFRGEALASIASVSRLTLLSRPREQESAYAVDSEGGDESEPRPAAGPVGTSVSVRSLFFNTPARRKFLKTDQTEATRVNEMVQSLALAHPTIAFTVTVDGRARFDTPPDQSPRDRVLAVVGRELADELLEVTRPGGGGEIAIWGLAGMPSVARSTSRHQRVYVNGRAIVDRSIAHAIKEAYRGLIEPTRTPTIVLFLEMDPTSVDVNVHPTKAEVRFRHPSHVHGAVLNAVRAALRERDLTPAFDLGRSAPALGTGGVGAGGTAAGAGAIVDCFRRLDPKEKGFVYSEVKAALAQEAPEILERAASTALAAESQPAVLPTVRVAPEVLQIHASYLVTQDEAGLLIIDQHALHERVMFETLHERVEAGPLESQRLLMPAVVPVDGRQIEMLAELAPLLARLGIDAEPMGPKTVAVHAFTSLLFERGVDPVTFMQELLGRTDVVADGGPGSGTEAALHEVLDMMACKAAIKAGDRLEPAEIRELLDRRESVERSSNCPHGRPTTLRLSLRDLERQFGRT